MIFIKHYFTVFIELTRWITRNIVMRINLHLYVLKILMSISFKVNFWKLEHSVLRVSLYFITLTLLHQVIKFHFIFSMFIFLLLLNLLLYSKLFKSFFHDSTLLLTRIPIWSFPTFVLNLSLKSKLNSFL